MRRAALLLVTAAVIVGCGGGSTDPASKLASEDGSSDTAAYSAALTTFASDCTQSKVKVASIVDFAYNDLKQNHVTPPSRLELMQQLSPSADAAGAPTDCNAIVAAYLVIAES